MYTICLRLCFKKGDIITITQREEGGWWEGTLGDKTGWVPSNYVKEYKIQGMYNYKFRLSYKVAVLYQHLF